MKTHGSHVTYLPAAVKITVPQGTDVKDMILDMPCAYTPFVTKEVKTNMMCKWPF